MPYDLTKPETACVVVFELDDTSLHGHARFARFLDEHRALGRLTAEVELGWGRWEGATNVCYVMSQRDFDRHLTALSVFIADQQAIMQVGPSGAASIVSVDGDTLAQGKMQRVTMSELAQYPGYTLLKRGAFVMQEII